MNQSWDEFRKAIAKEFAEHQDDFLRQPTIAHTMHPVNDKLAVAYHDELWGTPYGRRLIGRALDLDYGKPRRVANECSMSALQHAWQLWNIGELVKSLQHVAEIGGGYGDMARQIHAAGFRGTYEIFDFPELHQIQSAYLERCDVPVNFKQLTDYTLKALDSRALLLAMFSVSEMPLEQRAEIEPMFFTYDYLAFSWNESFAGIDNHAWFQGLSTRLLPQFDIHMKKDPHMRGWYLFGIRK